MVPTGTSDNLKGERGEWTSPLSYYRSGPRKGSEVFDESKEIREALVLLTTRRPGRLLVLELWRGKLSGR